jgi:hypothetical protein
MTRPVVVEITHRLGKEEARRRIAGGFDRIRSQIGFATTFEERWEEDRLHFGARALGQSIVGRLDVADEKVRIELDLPPGLAFLAQSIRGRLGRGGALLLGKPQSPE